MNNREWESRNEKDFETMLESSISGFPPEDVVAGVTPWKKAMNRALIGMALYVLTLNFWCLNYILPAIGMVLSLLGFRTLRCENKWFRNCFIITVIQSAFGFSMLVLNTTIIQSTIFTFPVTSVQTIANVLLLLAEFFCLWGGLRDVQRKVNLPPRAGGAAALIIWYVLMCILAVIRYQGLIIAGAMIIGYFFIIRSIYKLSKELDEAGYSIQTVSIKITDKCIVLALVLMLIIGCIFGYLFGGSYPMEWSTVDSSEHGEVEDIKNHLIKLGFPENVLDDLTPEDIAACDGALQVVVYVKDEAVNDGRTVTTWEWKYDNSGHRHIDQGTTGYDVKELRMTGVGVQVPGEEEEWIIFHHFLWMTNPGFYGTEFIQIQPVYQYTSEGWASIGEATGHVLYDKDGKTFSAPYYSLGEQTYTTSSFFWGERTRRDIFATFSMPAKGENCRGYAAYPVAEVQDGWDINSWFNYTHQNSWLQYPAVTAIEAYMKNNGWVNTGVFRSVQSALQFAPTDENPESF